MKSPPRTVFALSFVLASLSAALADPSGTWQREDGKARVRIAPCGSNYCGSVIWVKEPDRASSVGKQVFYDMEASGPNSWSGKAFNPEDGRTYSGRMILSGSSLTTSGCVLGGIICKLVNWNKGN
jgi:uncharacterized protein (DUF2147 family)